MLAERLLPLTSSRRKIIKMGPGLDGLFAPKNGRLSASISRGARLEEGKRGGGGQWLINYHSKNLEFRKKEIKIRNKKNERSAHEGKSQPGNKKENPPSERATRYADLFRPD